MAGSRDRTDRRRGPCALALAAGLAVAVGCGPIGPVPGGELDGEVVETPVTDWSFTADVETVQLETRPDDPYSVNTWIFGEDERLYVPTSLILGSDDPRERQWVKNVLADPRVRVRIDGRLYPLRAERVTDPAEAEAARSRLLAKYEIEPDAEGHAEAAWIFRLAPR